MSFKVMPKFVNVALKAKAVGHKAKARAVKIWPRGTLRSRHGLEDFISAKKYRLLKLMTEISLQCSTLVLTLL